MAIWFLLVLPLWFSIEWNDEFRKRDDKRKSVMGRALSSKNV